MASALPTPPITIEQYLTFESPVGFRDELNNGTIIISPEPKALHFDVADNLYKLITKAAGRKYRVAQRVNLQFPDVNTMPSPDVFVIALAEWKRARLEEVYPDGSKVRLAIEMLSPGNRNPALLSKINIYTTHGLEAWLVDLKRQEVKVYRGKKTDTFSVKNDSAFEWNGKAVPLSAIFRLS